MILKQTSTMDHTGKLTSRVKCQRCARKKKKPNIIMLDAVPVVFRTVFDWILGVSTAFFYVRNHLYLSHCRWNGKKMPRKHVLLRLLCFVSKNNEESGKNLMIRIARFLFCSLMHDIILFSFSNGNLRHLLVSMNSHQIAKIIGY